MRDAYDFIEFRQKVETLLLNWTTIPPTREAYLDAAKDLTAWRTRRNHVGLWVIPPLMVTATIDDGWGHGLEIIEKLAQSAGLHIHPLGLMQPSHVILEACWRIRPHFLGLTVLQFDSDDQLTEILHGLPASTRLIAGGAAFQYDTGFAERTGTHVAIQNGTAFLRFLLDESVKIPYPE